MNKWTTNKNQAFKALFIACQMGLMLLLGCAKEMDERLPDNAHRDIHPVETFESTVVIETVDEQPRMFSLRANEIERGFLALNEVRLRSVRFVSGPENLKALFSDLQIESSSAGEKFEVVFKKTDSRISAFLVVDEKRTLSSANQQLVRTVNGKSAVPLFHYTATYGRYISRLNSIDEATRFRDFEVADRSIATHIRFTATPETRRLDGLYGEPDSKIMLKNSLSNRLWGANEIVRFFNISNAQETETFLTSSAEVVKTEIIDNKMYIFQVVERSSLDPIQARFFERGDLRIKQCTDDVLARTVIRNAQDCVLKAVLVQDLTHVRLDLRTDNGDFTGSIVVERDADSRITNLVQIPLERRIQRFRFQDVASIEEENVFRRDSIENNVHSADYIQSILNISDVKGNDQIKTKILGANLLFMVPRAVSSLTAFEQAALESNDPRFDVCPVEILNNWNTQEECAMVTLYARPITYTDIRLRINENNDLQDIVVDRGVNRATSQLIQVDIRSAATEFKFNELLGVGDNVLTVKNRQFDTEAEYMYVPFTHGAPREVTAAHPFFMGAEKIVKLRFVKEGLEIYEQERDARFRNNNMNDLPVMLIPGAFLSFKCLEDAQGDCTLTTIPDTHVTWDKAQLFIPNFQNVQVRELNTLDLFGLDTDPCVYNIGSQLVDYSVDKGVLNFELEKTYKTNPSWRCIIDNYLADTVNLTGFSQAGFKVQFNYSLVRLDDLRTHDYEAVPYPIQDHRTFGFFKSYEQSLNDFFDSRRMEETYLLNRWNPNRGELVYHLSDSFNEPGQELIKAATYKSVEGINRALQEANAKISIRLEEPSGKKPGDLRYNVIQLITDPLANGLLGYAPTVKNPRTGEIVSAHINMYSGVIQSMTRRVWESMVDHTIKENQERTLERSRKVKAPRLAIADDHGDEIPYSFSEAQYNKIKYSKSKIAVPATTNARAQSPLASMQDRMQEMMLQRMRRSVPANYVEIRELSELEKKAKKEQERLDHWAKNNAYAEEFFRIAHTVKALLPGTREIPGVLNADGTLKRWNDLNDAQRQAASNIIAPYAYTSTFVHEFGHSLGLRHNFSGSIDGANFYTDEEARARGLRQAPAYSSIMDYAFSEMNELTIFGKYDVAALRFAYAREVELADGRFVPVTTTISDLENELTAQGLALKDYKYCTDENAGLSSSCNRFDEGTTLVEITDHMIQRYYDAHKYLNYRDDRNRFKDSNLFGITIWNMRNFEKVRNVFEDWEFYASIFGEGLMVQGCGPQDLAQYPVCKDINDRRDAVIKAGEFFINVLKTPDHLCAIISNEDPEAAVKTIVLADFYEESMQYDARYRNYVPKSCFDPQVIEAIEENEKSTVVAENGMYFNDVRGYDDRFVYADDRAVIGSWVDRILAMKALMQREQASFNTETGHMALVEHPSIMPQFMGFMNHILLNEPLESPIPFVDQAGNKFDIPYALNNYVIKAPGDDLYYLKLFLRTNTDSGAQTEFAQPLLGMINMWSTTNDSTLRNQSIQLHNDFAVRKFDLSTPINQDLMSNVIIDDTIYSSTAANTFSNLMINSISALDFLNEVLRADRDLLIRVLNARLNPTLPPDLTPLQRFAVQQVPGSLLQNMIELADEGVDLGLDVFVNQFGQQAGTLLFQLYNLGADEMRRLKHIQDSLGNVPPADAGEIERALYTISPSILESFARGTLQGKVEHYQKTLRHMPENIRL